ncbi:MAG: glycoside hydrolase family 13 protein [Clostridiales bacterium]|nr:glycoside hydrolase family 13 protein [Clostridiales bacterium]
MLFHDSHDPAYRSPVGPVKTGEKITLRFLCDEADHVTLRTWDGSEGRISMTDTGDNLFEATVTVPDSPMLFWYDFIIHRADGDARYGTSLDQLGGVGSFYYGQPQSYQVTVYDPAYTTPEYLRHGVIYQIFPDRFFRDALPDEARQQKIAAAHPEATFHQDWNDRPTLDIDPVTKDNRALDFFGGTLSGIAEKLDWLRELGVTILYINPVFRSRTNHRYDTGNYEEIDPILGDEDSFRQLIAAANERGMQVMMDGVFSHTGSDSKYFNRFGRYPGLGAYQSKESPYYHWYTFFDFPDHYNTWWGFDTLPTVIKDHPDYQNYLLNEETGIIPHWVRKGACGWRLDVADELPVPFLQKMRRVVKNARPDAVLLGEVWEDASNKVSYGQARSYVLGDTLDSVMNYPLRRGIIDFFTGSIDAYQLRRIILNQQEVYPAPFYYSLMNLLGSHDRVRIVNAMAGFDREGAIQMDREEASHIHLDDAALAAARQKVLEAYRLLCALPGVPTVYYGDEIGMQGMADPWNRAPMDWEHQDEALRNQFKTLLNQRLHTPMLQTGFMTVTAEDENTLLIRRYSENGLDAFHSPISGDEVLVRVQR